MQTIGFSTIRVGCHSFREAICAGAVLLVATSAMAQSQNLFSYDYYVGPNVGSIYEVNIAGGIAGSGGTFTSFPPGYGGPGYTGPLWTTHGDGLAVNSAGNVFLSDTSGNIFGYTPNGVQSTFASGVNGSLACDSFGNLFVADSGSGNIYKYTLGGVQSTFVSGVNGSLACDKFGNLFVADGGSGNIYKYTPGGVQSTFASGVNGVQVVLAIDNAGNVFVEEYSSGLQASINVYTSDGVQSAFVSSVFYPGGMAVDSDGNLWVANNNDGDADEYSPAGVKLTHFDSGNLINGADIGFGPTMLAFQPVPEPSVFGLLAVGAIAFGVRLGRKCRPL
jgi:hypothetical protein